MTIWIKVTEINHNCNSFFFETEYKNAFHLHSKLFPEESVWECEISKNLKNKRNREGIKGYRVSGTSDWIEMNTQSIPEAEKIFQTVFLLYLLNAQSQIYEISHPGRRSWRFH